MVAQAVEGDERRHVGGVGHDACFNPHVVCIIVVRLHVGVVANIDVVARGGDGRGGAEEIGVVVGQQEHGLCAAVVELGVDAGIGAVGTQAVPAGRPVAVGVAVEVVGEGQRDGAALGAEGAADSHAGVAGATDCTYHDGVGGVAGVVVGCIDVSLTMTGSSSPTVTAQAVSSPTGCQCRVSVSCVALSRTSPLTAGQVRGVIMMWSTAAGGWVPDK